VNGSEAITLAAALIGAAAGLWAVAATLKGNRQLLAVKHNVVNDHSTNLREEMDEWRTEERDSLRAMRAEMRSEVGGLRKDLGGLRGELREEREERIRSEGRIVAEFRRHS
jgi:hypothetical protein